MGEYRAAPGRARDVPHRRSHHARTARSPRSGRRRLLRRTAMSLRRGSLAAVPFALALLILLPACSDEESGGTGPETAPDPSSDPIETSHVEAGPLIDAYAAALRKRDLEAYLALLESPGSGREASGFRFFPLDQDAQDFPYPGPGSAQSFPLRNDDPIRLALGRSGSPGGLQRRGSAFVHARGQGPTAGPVLAGVGRTERRRADGFAGRLLPEA
jgi:hypothetical protein